MNVRTLSRESGVRAEVSEAEWEARVELAAAYRLMDHYGMIDLAHNHVCLRVPDEPDAFLMKPHAAFFNEVTASTLHKFDFDGEPRQEGVPKLTGGGVVIHGGLFSARPDINATIHSHSPAIIGVASQKHGLLPLSQHAMMFHGRIAYHDFGGFEFDMAMREPLIAAMEGKTIGFLRNHGSLICGATIGAVFVDHYELDIACQAQIATLSAGIDQAIMISPEVQEFASKQIGSKRAGGGGGKDWAGCLRLADQLFPDLHN